MVKSLPSQVVTYETRRESHDKVNKKKKYEQIIYILSRFPQGLTAKEIAVQAYKLGYSRSDHRDEYAPRLTELSKIGVVEPFEKVTCKYTGNKVSIYRLIKEPRQLNIFDEEVIL